MFLTTPQPYQCSARALQGPIVDLPNYSRGQTTERFYLNGTCTETIRFKQLVPFAIAERFIVTKPRQTRLCYRLLKTSYYSERNYGSSMEERMQRAGEHSNNDIYLSHVRKAMNAMNGGRDKTRANKDLQPYLFIIYTIT